MVSILAIGADMDKTNKARLLCIPGVFLGWPKASSLFLGKLNLL
jgi:hypothetical protein